MLGFTLRRGCIEPLMHCSAGDLDAVGSRGYATPTGLSMFGECSRLEHPPVSRILIAIWNWIHSAVTYVVNRRMLLKRRSVSSLMGWGPGSDSDPPRGVALQDFPVLMSIHAPQGLGVLHGCLVLVSRRQPPVQRNQELGLQHSGVCSAAGLCEPDGPQIFRGDRSSYVGH